MSYVAREELFLFHPTSEKPALASCAYIFQAAIMVYQCIRGLGLAYLTGAL